MAPAPDPTAPGPGGTACRTAEELAANVDAVRQRIVGAAARVGRDPAAVRLIPVSKTVHDARLGWAHRAGIRLLGENKAQEARAKAATFAALPGLRWAMIGHLQTNKVPLVVGSAAEVQSLDSLKLAEALDRRLQAAGLGLDVFVQVNSSGEPAKFGLDPAEVPAFVRALAPCASLRLRGLMTLAVLSPDPAAVRRCFARTRALRDRVREEGFAPETFAELSMGMSGDYEIAVEEGSTTVRVGQAIFGTRPPGPDPSRPRPLPAGSR